MDAYLERGIREIWLICPETKTIMLHTSTGALRFGEGSLFLSQYVPGWQLAVTELFSKLQRSHESLLPGAG